MPGGPKLGPEEMRSGKGRHRLLLFEHGCSLLVHQNGALEFAEICGARGGQLYLLYDQLAFIVKLVSFGRDGGMVRREIEIYRHGVWRLIHDIAGGQVDVETISPAAGCVQVDGNGSRLVVAT